MNSSTTENSAVQWLNCKGIHVRISSTDPTKVGIAVETVIQYYNKGLEDCDFVNSPTPVFSL